MAAVLDWASLKQDVSDQLHRSDLDAFMPGFIQKAEAKMNREVNARIQDTVVTLVSVAGVQTINAPSDFLQVRALQLVGTTSSQELTYYEPQVFFQKYGTVTSGEPRAWTVIRNVLYLGPVPQTIYNFNLIYQAALAGLSGSNTTNSLLLYAPHVYSYAVCLEAAIYMKDKDYIGLFKQLYEDSITDLNTLDNYSANVGVVRTDYRT
jgi:hypothetical protein